MRVEHTPRVIAALFAAILVLACQPSAPAVAPTARLTALEASYQDLRYVRDQIDVTRARGADTSIHGIRLTALESDLREEQDRFAPLHASVPRSHLMGEDRQAFDVMGRVWEADLRPGETALSQLPSTKTPDCGYDVPALAALRDGLDSLTSRVMDCYGIATRSVELDGERLDRLTVLGLLPRTDDPDRRRRLFLALEPIWRSVNRSDDQGSPYRQLLLLRTRRWTAEEFPMATPALAFGIDPDTMEQWLVSVLEQWKAISPDTLVEPWDYYYANGVVSRVLGPRIPRDSLRSVNDRYYRTLGADPDTLGLEFDLEPRDGKYPVAYTTFGARNRFADGRWLHGEPWIFASYGVGGLDNLAELLHETGHGIHIAGIHTRPAFLDWPDSDTFTEALADLPALEVYEPTWQYRYLGDSVPLPAGIRGKYSWIMFDIAWALFETRVHRDPSIDPNVVWTDLTREYLGIKPHPELSWWAMRGQLIEAPGYMMNYAVGSLIVAALRARVAELRGGMAEDDAAWYPWVSERLYRFGLERPSRQVLEDFLGGPLTPSALLADLARASPPPLGSD